METKLARIAQLSAENPDMVFTSLGHLINYDMLKDCHALMDGDKAVGIDGITKEEYGKNLDENIKDLVEKLKSKSYRPKPARRVEICICEKNSVHTGWTGRARNVYHINNNSIGYIDY